MLKVENVLLELFILMQKDMELKLVVVKLMQRVKQQEQLKRQHMLKAGKPLQNKQHLILKDYIQEQWVLETMLKVIIQPL